MCAPSKYDTALNPKIASAEKNNISSQKGARRAPRRTLAACTGAERVPRGFCGRLTGTCRAWLAFR
ncbi:MAG: hypothetical protein Kow00124_27520 [Anaerolineae bacterium]